MFRKGEYVVYGTKGVCYVQDIAHVDIPGADKDRLYYILSPAQSKNGTVYLPTDSQKAVIRRVMSQSEARQLLEDIPVVENLRVEDEKKREERYKEAMKSCSSRMWVSMIKTLNERKNERIAAGKKITALDERYLRAAKQELCVELSIVLDATPEEMESCIYDRLKNPN